jgi:hypothetical protein
MQGREAKAEGINLVWWNGGGDTWHRPVGRAAQGEPSVVSLAIYKFQLPARLVRWRVQPDRGAPGGAQGWLVLDSPSASDKFPDLCVFLSELDFGKGRWRWLGNPVHCLSLFSFVSFPPDLICLPFLSSMTWSLISIPQCYSRSHTWWALLTLFELPILFVLYAFFF